jgi:hypothetical protein
MSETSLEPRTRRWLAWEWWAALITVVGGAAIALGVAAYFTFRTPPLSPEAAQTARFVHDAQLVCSQALTSAKNFGIVPRYAQLANPMPAKTPVTGRYVCIAGTTVGHYNIAVDLLCPKLGEARCIGLYAVVQDDGTVLYRRRS